MIIRFNPVDISPEIWEYIYKNTTLSNRPFSEDQKEAAFDKSLKKVTKAESLPSDWKTYLKKVINSQFMEVLGGPRGQDFFALERDAGVVSSDGEVLSFEERFSAQDVSAGATDEEILGEEEKIQRKLDRPTLEALTEMRNEFIKSPASPLSETERKVFEYHTASIPFRVIAKKLPAFLTYQEAYKRCFKPVRSRRRKRSYDNPSYLKRGEELYKEASELTLQALGYKAVAGTPHFGLIRQAVRLYQEATRYFLAACGQSTHSMKYFQFTQKDVADLYFSAIRKFNDTYEIPEDLRELRNPHDRYFYS